jgi:hypothetical protein
VAVGDLRPAPQPMLDELGADVVLVRLDFHGYGAGSRDDAAELATGFRTRLDAFAPIAIS